MHHGSPWFASKLPPDTLPAREGTLAGPHAGCRWGRERVLPILLSARRRIASERRRRGRASDRMFQCWMTRH